MRIGQKVFVKDNGGRLRPGAVTEIWEQDGMHGEAGFRADIHEGRWVNNAEFNDYDIGKSVFTKK